MGRDMNPYGVGQAGERIAERRHCTCCGLPFEWEGPYADRFKAQRCKSCREHSETTVDGRLALLGDHADRYRHLQEAAWEMVRKTKSANQRLRQQTAAALQSLDRYEAIVNDLWERHFEEDDGSCACGQGDCEVLDILNRRRNP